MHAAKLSTSARADGHAVSLRINLLEIDGIARVEERLHRITPMQPAIVRQQPCDILHDEPFRTDAFEQPDVVLNQQIARVLAGLHPGTAKPLTRGATQQDVEFTRKEATLGQQHFTPGSAHFTEGGDMRAS